MNQQREVIYDLRLFALEGGEDLKGEIWEMIEHAAREVIDEYAPGHESAERWDLAGLKRRLEGEFLLHVSHLPDQNDPQHENERHEVEAWVLDGLKESFHFKLQSLGEHSEQVSSFIMLSVIDDKWKDHLYDLDHLKASIGFRGWGQKDPLVEYKKEAYEMFVDLMTDLRKTLANYFFRAQFGPPQRRVRQPQRLSYSGPTDAPAHGVADRAAQASPPAQAPRARQRDDLGMSARAAAGLTPTGPDPATLSTNRGERQKQEPVTASDEPGRNDPCPCGSGKKYKKCHGGA